MVRTAPRTNTPIPALFLLFHFQPTKHTNHSARIKEVEAEKTALEANKAKLKKEKAALERRLQMVEEANAALAKEKAALVKRVGVVEKEKAALAERVGVVEGEKAALAKWVLVMSCAWGISLHVSVFMFLCVIGRDDHPRFPSVRTRAPQQKRRKQEWGDPAPDGAGGAAGGRGQVSAWGMYVVGA